MERKEVVVVGAAIGLVLYTLILGALTPALSAIQSNKTISNAGSVKAIGVGIYWDQACANTVSSIDWGTIEPGVNVNRTVYVRNEGNAAATLSMVTSNWNPSNASAYMTLIWDYGGQALDANEVVQVKLTLSVSADIAGISGFSFDIIISANG